MKRLKKGLNYLSSINRYGEVNLYYTKSEFKLDIVVLKNKFIIKTFLTKNQYSKRDDLVLTIDEAYKLGLVNENTYKECQVKYSSTLDEKVKKELKENNLYDTFITFIEPNEDGIKVYIETIKIDE